MFDVGTQLWISRRHEYLEACSKSPKVRDTDISLYIHLDYFKIITSFNSSNSPTIATIMCQRLASVFQSLNKCRMPIIPKTHL